MTYRNEGIREKAADTFVEVSPELATQRGIQSGTWVELTSRYGQVRVRALVTDRMQGKELYMPMNSVESPLNRLTSSYTDAEPPGFWEVSHILRSKNLRRGLTVVNNLLEALGKNFSAESS
jgi:formate dehydrogenase major subunit